MQDTKILIREAESTDIFALTELMNELGYDTTIDEMKVRFENIQNQKEYKTFIAAAGPEIVGMVGVMKNYSYEHNGIYVRVLALVAENWAREIGADKVLLNCGNREEREIAQLFYKKIGYQVKSSGFIKKLS